MVITSVIIVTSIICFIYYYTYAIMIGLRNRYQKLCVFFRFFELFKQTISGKEFTHKQNGQIFGMEGS